MLSSSIAATPATRSYLFNQKANHLEQYIHNKLIQDYQTTPQDYHSTIIKTLLHNESSHYVVSYKELLLLNNPTEFIRKCYCLPEAIEGLLKLINYYDKYAKIFPNYNVLNEGKYFFRNIQRKQIMIDLQEEMEYEEKGKKQKLDEGIDMELNEDLFNTHVIESIANESNNKEDIALMFDIDDSKDNGFGNEGIDEDRMIKGIEHIIRVIDASKKVDNKRGSCESLNTSLSFLLNDKRKIRLPRDSNDSNSKRLRQINEDKKSCSSTNNLIRDYLKQKIERMREKEEINNSLNRIQFRNADNSSNCSNNQIAYHKNNSSNSSSLQVKTQKDPLTVREALSHLKSALNLNHKALSVQFIKARNNQKKPPKHHVPEQNISNTMMIYSRNSKSNSQLNLKVNKSVILHKTTINNKSKRLFKETNDRGLTSSFKDLKRDNSKGLTIVNDIASKLNKIKLNEISRNPNSFQVFLKETLKMIDSSKKRFKPLEKTKSCEDFRQKMTDKEVQVQIKESKIPYKVIFTKDKKIVTQKISPEQGNCNRNQRVYEYQSSLLSSQAFDTKDSRQCSYNSKEKKLSKKPLKSIDHL